MFDVDVFGGCLRSELEFPDLAPARNVLPTWTLHVRYAPAPAPIAFLGAESVMPGVAARLFTTADGWLLQFDDTGEFTISADGARLAWHPHADSSPGEARLDVIGRVLPLALHAQGRFCLHASAVAIGDNAVAFIAPKGTGKSTLAAALVTRGARLLTDDTLPVEHTRVVPMALPGVRHLRLRLDSLAQLGSLVPAEPELFADKHAFLPPASHREARRLPLRAIYLLEPCAPHTLMRGPRREDFNPMVAALTLVAHAKIGGLLGSHAAGSTLRCAARLAQAVPVARLIVPRDLDRLEDVAQWIEATHGSEPRPATRDPRIAAVI
jgi:hypothetical protein